MFTSGITAIDLLFETAAGAVVLSTTPRVRADSKPAVTSEKKESPAETLVKELFAGLNEEQKKSACYPWNDSKRSQINPNRSIGTPILSISER